MQLTDKDRALAAGIAAAHPLTPAVRIKAKGNHLAAQNDEPEPLSNEEHLLEADRAYQQRKDSGDLTRACDERAMRRETFGSELDRATWMRTAL